MYIPYEVNGFENKVVNYNLINDANPFQAVALVLKSIHTVPPLIW